VAVLSERAVPNVCDDQQVHSKEGWTPLAIMERPTKNRRPGRSWSWSRFRTSRRSGSREVLDSLSSKDLEKQSSSDLRCGAASKPRFGEADDRAPPDVAARRPLPQGVWPASCLVGLRRSVASTLPKKDMPGEEARRITAFRPKLCTRPASGHPRAGRTASPCESPSSPRDACFWM